MLDKTHQYIKHYLGLVKAYKRDNTEEGMLYKYAKMTEAEYVLRNVFCMTDEEIKELWGM